MTLVKECLPCVDDYEPEVSVLLARLFGSLNSIFFGQALLSVKPYACIAWRFPIDLFENLHLPELKKYAAVGSRFRFFKGALEHGSADAIARKATDRKPTACKAIARKAMDREAM